MELGEILSRRQNFVQMSLGAPSRLPCPWEQSYPLEAEPIQETCLGDQQRVKLLCWETPRSSPNSSHVCILAAGLPTLPLHPSLMRPACSLPAFKKYLQETYSKQVSSQDP